MTDAMDPKNLMQRAREGDQQAFSLLYQHYLTPIYRYLYFRMLHREDAEDLLQTVFLKAYQALPRFTEKGKDPLSFFYTIARNAVIDHRRKKREALMDESDDIALHLADDAPGIAELAIRRSEGALVREALKSLSDDQREVLTLKYINDLSNQEIAQLIGKQEPAVRQLQSRGLRALRELFHTTHG